MADFTFAFPEHEGLDVLRNLRRPMLLQLANAFGIQHPQNCIKEKLIPLLENYVHVTPDGRIASNDGNPPANPDYLLPAGQRPERVAAREAAKNGNKSVIQVSKDIPERPYLDPLNELSYKWRGPSHKWCVMNGDEIVQKGLNKEDAIAACG